MTLLTVSAYLQGVTQVRTWSSRLVEIFYVTGRNASLLFVTPGTRLFFGWMTKEYLGIRKIITDRDYESVNLEFEVKKLTSHG